MNGRRFPLLLVLLLLCFSQVSAQQNMDLGNQIRSEILNIRIELLNSNSLILSLNLDIQNLKKIIQNQKQDSQTFSRDRVIEMTKHFKSLRELEEKRARQQEVSDGLLQDLIDCQKRLKFYLMTTKVTIGALIISIGINILQAVTR